jgi:hypothetical protein
MAKRFSEKSAADDFKIRHQFHNLQGCTNIGPLVARTTKYFTKEPNNSGSSVWKLLHVHFLALTVSKWLKILAKMCAPLFLKREDTRPGLQLVPKLSAG